MLTASTAEHHQIFEKDRLIAFCRMRPVPRYLWQEVALL